jgi:hypothetical protein
VLDEKEYSLNSFSESILSAISNTLQLVQKYNLIGKCSASGFGFTVNSPTNGTGLKSRIRSNSELLHDLHFIKLLIYFLHLLPLLD